MVMARVGQASTQRGPSGDFAHRSHTTTLVYAPVSFWRSSPAERADDAGLAAQNIELMAAAQGLGVLFNGYLCRASEELPAVRAFLGADERPLQMCLLLGCPAVSYPRTAPRMPGDFVVK